VLHTRSSMPSSRSRSFASVKCGSISSMLCRVLAAFSLCPSLAKLPARNRRAMVERGFLIYGDPGAGGCVLEMPVNNVSQSHARRDEPSSRVTRTQPLSPSQQLQRLGRVSQFRLRPLEPSLAQRPIHSVWRIGATAQAMGNVCHRSEDVPAQR
jgi:hypothetical protein